MPVERIDSRFTTAVKTRNPFRLFRGKRTWSPLKPGEIFSTVKKVSKSQRNGFEQSIRRSPDRTDTIEIRTEEIFGGLSKGINTEKVIKREEINDPTQPWYSKLRFANPKQVIE